MLRLLLSSTPDPGSWDGLIEAGTKLVTWLITTMTSFVTFMLAHPILMVGIMIGIISFAVGLLVRFVRVGS